jgi:hypothetical protein
LFPTLPPVNNFNFSNFAFYSLHTLSHKIPTKRQPQQVKCNSPEQKENDC